MEREEKSPEKINLTKRCRYQIGKGLLLSKNEKQGLQSKKEGRKKNKESREDGRATIGEEKAINHQKTTYEKKIQRSWMIETMTNENIRRGTSLPLPLRVEEKRKR